ncbi:methyltransferase domain-containing protein [Streptosporangium sp. NPDC023615]|uniref:SAM-dependent methyltransferase n=1 Tax=Streptosporangium sp. NPDC023615 TaxID=3154794 RepID=UPI0034178236
MSLRFHEIAEGRRRILNPITDAKLDLLGEVARLRPGMRQLDLASGKGEMLCRWAAAHGVEGVGVDISHVFHAAAVARAVELGVEDKVRFERAEAARYAAGVKGADYDLVSCIGATWIGGGLTGTLGLMLPALAEDGTLLVGEPYWIDEPPPEAYEALGMGPGEFTSLGGTLERFESCGVELAEMVLADGDGWDRYMASQWWSLADHLAAEPADPEADEIQEFLDRARSSHLRYGRRYLGWGVFVLRRPKGRPPGR